VIEPLLNHDTISYHTNTTQYSYIHEVSKYQSIVKIIHLDIGQI